ncbi:MAG: hypothetical protein OFPII_29110 [Osedax symbiont Rs1]|nr:MAG: hypothetical protein OFPII_29110 [Osedax symbiont Rs1]
MISANKNNIEHSSLESEREPVEIHTNNIGTAEQLKDPNYFPPLRYAIPLGIQHVLAMFVSNVTPAIIIAGAAGFGFVQIPLIFRL